MKLNEHKRFVEFISYQIVGWYAIDCYKRFLIIAITINQPRKSHKILSYPGKKEYLCEFDNEEQKGVMLKH